VSDRVLSYVQGGSADVWKENVLEELEVGEVEYKSVEEFLLSLKKEFGGEEEELVKAAELRKLEQEGRTMEEFIQEFKRAARGSEYEGRSLVEEFKKKMNGAIRRKLMEAENQPGSIEQWFRRAMVSRMKEVDLTFSYFLSLVSFRFIFLYSIFRTMVRVRGTRSRYHIAGHIR